MSIIKSGNSNDMWAIDEHNAARVTYYRKDGRPMHYFQKFRGACSTFSTIGNAAATQNIFTIENYPNSVVDVYVKKLFLWNDNTAAITTVACDCSVSRITAASLPITTGTILAKQSYDTNLGSSQYVVIRGGATADNNNGSITVTAASPYLYRNFILRLHTAIGQVQTGLISLLNDLTSDTYTDDYQPIKLQPGEGLVVQILNTTAASNAATNHYMINCSWDEVLR